MRAPRPVVRRENGLWAFERVLQRCGFPHVAGADEAGRGACAGPLVVAAVVLPPGARGEVVVFDGEGSFTEPEFRVPEPTNGLQRALRTVTGAIGLGATNEKDYIKRVIGLPGDRVSCCTNGRVTVQPAGSDRAVELEEPYVFEDNEMVFCEAGTDPASCPPGAPGVLVPEGRIFVLGDHRSESSDSRFYLQNSDKGTVPIDEVIGRAFVIVWPLGRADVLSVPDTFDGGGLAGAGMTATPYALGMVGALPITLLRRRRRSRT